jgi:hypothetical protein
MGIGFLALCVLCVLLFPRSLLQEGNPLPVFQAIAQLELSGTGAIPLDAQQRQWLKRPDARADQDGLRGVLAHQGWELTYREGMGRSYKNGERTWRLTCRMYTSSYEICEGDRSP